MRPIWWRKCLPQIVHFRPVDGWVEDLAALAFSAARLLTAVSLRRCSADLTPVVCRNVEALECGLEVVLGVEVK